MASYNTKFYNEMNSDNNELVFIDLEANQDINNNNLSTNNHYLLELSGIKSSGGEVISKFSEKVFQRTPLNKQVASLLNKPQDYYSNVDFQEEDETYSDFVEFTKGATIITYGDYDQTVLNAVAQRYKLPRIYLFDICEEIKRKLNIKKDCSPSLSAIAYAFGINQDKYQKHEAAADAQLLFDIYLEYLDWEKNKLFFLRENIMNELIRPTKYKEYIKRHNKFEIPIASDFCYVLDNSEIRERRQYEDEENNTDPTLYYTYCLDIKVYNQKGELVESFIKEWSTTTDKHEPKQVVNEARYKIAREYTKKAVFICRSKFKTSYSEILTNIFEDKIPLVYTVSSSILNYVLGFSFYDINTIQDAISRINKFYNSKKQDFSTIIEYFNGFNI